MSENPESTETHDLLEDRAGAGFSRRSGAPRPGLSAGSVSANHNEPKGLAPRPHADTLSRRRLLTATAATLGLAACGFTPVYGPGGQAQGLRGQILVAEPRDRDSFTLVARLEDRLGQPDAAPYFLDYTVSTERKGVGITPSRETTRYNLLGRLDYRVTDRATGAVLTQGSVDSFTGYSATGSIVGTISATEDASERLMTILADQLVTQLIATAPDWRA